MEAILTWVVLVAAAIGGVSYMWSKVLKPAAEFIAEWPDAYKVLLEISEEFKPNAGASLRDRIQILEDGQADMSRQVGNLTQQIEVHLIGQDPSAPRSLDA